MAWTVSGRLPNIPSTGPSAPSVRDVASFPDIEAAAWYHAVPAAVLGDQVRYVRVGESLASIQACALSDPSQKLAISYVPSTLSD